MKTLITIVVFFILSIASVGAQGAQGIFPKGEKGSTDYFTGNAYNHMLVKMDSVFTTLSGSVTFEPGARSHWHSHPAGQILMVTSGTGYHQVRGKPKETIARGDVVKCPPNTDHWHGATENTAMTHIFIIPNTEKGIVDWKEAVTNEEFLKE